MPATGNWIDWFRQMKPIADMHKMVYLKTQASHAPQAHKARFHSAVASSSARGVVIKGLPGLGRPRLAGKVIMTPRCSLRRKRMA